MKIGYCVEGSNDRALLTGLRDRWCPQAELMAGRFRGEFKRREIPDACFELATKGADLIILLRDSNRENWREVLRRDRERLQPPYANRVVVGVCERNVECWFAADADWIARQFQRQAAEFRVDDPSHIFKSAAGITPLENREGEVAKLVADAPLNNWLANSISFENFYEQLRDQSLGLGCSFENLRERQR